LKGCEGEESSLFVVAVSGCVEKAAVMDIELSLFAVYLDGAHQNDDDEILASIIAIHIKV
jgi:hypothetical protein